MAVSDTLKTYLINLDSAQIRLAFMDEQLRKLGMDHERLSAIDGGLLVPPYPDFDERSYGRLHGRIAHPREIACYLSHIECLKRFLQTDADHALILEDDCQLPADLGEILVSAIAHAEEWDLLRLSTVNSGIRIPYRRLNTSSHLAVALTREKGAGAYVVNRRCAEVFVEELLPMRLAWDIAFDLEFQFRLKANFVEPPPVNQQTDMETQVQIELDQRKLPITRYFTVFPFRASMEINRFILRGIRLLKLLWLTRRNRSG